MNSLPSHAKPEAAGVPEAPPTTAVKRKRDHSIQQIITDIEGAKATIEDPSPDTIEKMDKILQKSKKALDNPEDDVENLELASQLLMKAIGLQGQLRSIDELRELWFLVEVGDWVTGIHMHVKGFEGKARGELRADYQRKLNADGWSGTNSATESARVYSADWKAAADKNVADTLARLAQESQQVRDWRLNGEVESNTPETPTLDFLVRMCEMAKIDYQAWLSYAEAMDARNDFVHHPPPRIEDHVTPEGIVDFKQLWESCKGRLETLRGAYQSGLLKVQQFDLFHDAVGLWLETIVESWDENGDAVLTKTGQQFVTKGLAAWKKAQVAVVQPLGVYEPGKWDKTVPQEALPKGGQACQKESHNSPGLTHESPGNLGLRYVW